tara:strand:+ start:216 stop:518 length:303 start_codon:yes stop_codon:yes gene_type:complete
MEIIKMNTIIQTKYTMADTEEVFNSYEDALEYIYAEEIIYYNRAMEYLSEHDFSLRDSLALADDFGFEIKNLSSETLATIHYQDFLINSLEEIKGDEMKN